MRTKATILIFVGLIALAGCNESKSPTGAAGERQLRGTIVTTGDLTGSSAAGITVRASSQGVEAVTGSNGAFILTGLPDGTIALQFVRTADGVNASLQVAPGVSQVTVALEKSVATVQGTAGGEPKIELEGLITAISSDSITVMDASRKTEITSVIDEGTTIRKGNEQLTTDDLEVGDRVHVRARVEADGSLTALEVKLQEGEDDEPGGETKKELEGLILEISADFITVMDASSGEQTAAITEETVIRKGNTVLTVDDLKVGDRVHVKAKIEDDDSLTAEEIKLQNPA